MKENFKIEELFQQKFQNFETDVNPSVWNNIQSSIGASAGATTGMSALLKAGLIGGGIIAATIITYVAVFNDTKTEKQPIIENNNISENTISEIENTNQTDESLIVVENVNDPVIIENKEKIETELRTFKSNDNSQTVNTTQTNANTNSAVVNINTNSAISNQNNSQNQTQNTNSNNQNNSASVEPTKIVAPTGRMEYSMTGTIPVIVTFNANSQNAKQVKWDFGDGTFGETEETKHTYSKAGTYRVRLTIIGNGGLNYEEVQEIVIKSKSSIDNIPNVITPNGDRINDYFSVKSTDIEIFNITIVDKNGREVFSSNDKDFIWDGTDYSGEFVNKGMYTYVIIAEGKDGSVIKIPGQLYVQ